MLPPYDDVPRARCSAPNPDSLTEAPPRGQTRDAQMLLATVPFLIHSSLGATLRGRGATTDVTPTTEQPPGGRPRVREPHHPRDRDVHAGGRWLSGPCRSPRAPDRGRRQRRLVAEPAQPADPPRPHPGLQPDGPRLRLREGVRHGRP